MEILPDPASAYTPSNIPQGVDTLQSGAQLSFFLSEPGNYTIILTDVTSQNSITNATVTTAYVLLQFGTVTYTGPGQGSIEVNKDGSHYYIIIIEGSAPAPASTVSNNKITSLKGGMPYKFGSADGSTSFNNARKSFTKSVLRSVTYEEPTKKLYGNSYRKDSSSIIADKKKNAIGASVNHLQQETSFGAQNPVESTTAKKALSRGSRYRF